MSLRRNAFLAAVAACALSASFLAPSVAQASDRDDSYTFAVIGDIPYGQAQIASFPAVVQQLNADPDVKFVAHLGDIKSGSSLCSDEYFASVRSAFDQFADPLVYTPGDNEWTDCHRTNNGGYDPLERLAAIRKVFFPVPNRTLGQRQMRVTSQAAQGFVENVRFERADVEFAAVHVVGSNNSTVPWTGRTAVTPEQAAEVSARTAADIALIRKTFAQAREERAKAVTLFLQADMFDETVTAPKIADYSAFIPIVDTIARESARFGRPVYLFNGDSHVFRTDQPLAAGSKWLSFYGITTAAPNLTRITVDGSTGVDNWIKVTVDEKNRTAPLSWVKVPFAG